MWEHRKDLRVSSAEKVHKSGASSSVFFLVQSSMLCKPENRGTAGVEMLVKQKCQMPARIVTERKVYQDKFILY
jgi:hypothetical protein